MFTSCLLFSLLLLLLYLFLSVLIISLILDLPSCHCACIYFFHQSIHVTSLLTFSLSVSLFSNCPSCHSIILVAVVADSSLPRSVPFLLLDLLSVHCCLMHLFFSSCPSLYFSLLMLVHHVLVSSYPCREPSLITSRQSIAVPEQEKKNREESGVESHS